MVFARITLAAIFALVLSAIPQPSLSSTASSAAPSSTTAAASTSSITSTEPMQTISSGGGSYTENWETTTDGSGISIKMSTTQDESSVLQFEYTNDGQTLYWDLSPIDLDQDSAFVKSGFSATPVDESCAAVTCAAGDADCSAAYQTSDDEATNSFSYGAGITVSLG
ncbi:hypothetical protein BDV12DRAFT_190919 [Aspergillus spectabilis]